MFVTKGATPVLSPAETRAPLKHYRRRGAYLLERADGNP